MDNIILALMEQIKTALPELSYIDEDFGQLDTYAGESNPVTFPCALIEVEGVDWNELSPREQSGSVNIAIRLVIDCYDDTHYGSGSESKIKERFAMCKRLHSALQGEAVDERMDYLTRVKSRNYTIGGGLKIYESNYQFDYHDGSAQY